MSPNHLFWAAVRESKEGPDITWIGPNPFNRGLCLGFDDGSVVLSVDATRHTTPHQKVSQAGDAVNGVAAGGGKSLAVSTRSDVTFVQIEKLEDRNHNIVAFPGGAHGVVATQSGYFVASLGPKGLLIVKPDNEPIQRMRVTNGTEGRLYFYRTIALHDSSGKETLVCALRRNGVGLSVFNGNEDRRNVYSMKFESVDVVDICGVAPDSLSAVAISPNAEVMWIKDTSKRDDPVAMKLIGIKGQVYRVLATSRHLFVLSSEALYVWSNLVDKVLYGNTSAPKSRPLVLPMEAVDMSLYEDEYILLVMAANAFMSLSIKDLERQPAELFMPLMADVSVKMSESTSVEDFVPAWRNDDIAQTMEAAVAG